MNQSQAVLLLLAFARFCPLRLYMNERCMLASNFNQTFVRIPHYLGLEWPPSSLEKKVVEKPRSMINGPSNYQA